MKGQFTHGVIVHGGTQIHVNGPCEFDDDELGAVIHARVTQGDAVARGDSAYIPRNHKHWTATLTVESGKFHPGQAWAYANADVFLKDGGTEAYPWDMGIPLEEIALK